MTPEQESTAEAKVRKQAATIERLREALEKVEIASGDTYGYIGKDGQLIKQVRAALAQKESE